MVTVVDVDFSSSSDPKLSPLSHRIPQFFDDVSQPCCEVNSYMRFLSRRLLPKSIKTTAEHMKEFLVWSEMSGVEVEDITDDIFDSYVDALCGYRRASGDFLSWNTVNARASGVYRYLIWCHERGYCPDLNPVEVGNAYGGVRKKYNTKGHPSKKLKDHTRFLILDVAVKLVDALSEVSGSVNPNVKLRNKLIGALMLQSGLRISEVSEFPLKDLPEINSRGHSTPARVVGKGGKARLVLIPNNLLLKLWRYVDFERERTAEHIEEIAGKDSVDITLFLSEKGRKLTSNWIEKLFSKASEKLGVKIVPHALRHTYGTYHYLLNRDLAGLANLMGHARESTTRNYYVQTAILISYAGSYRALQDEIDKLIGSDHGGE